MKRLLLLSFFFLSAILSAAESQRWIRTFLDDNQTTVALAAIARQLHISPYEIKFLDAFHTPREAAIIVATSKATEVVLTKIKTTGFTIDSTFGAKNDATNLQHGHGRSIRIENGAIIVPNPGSYRGVLLTKQTHPNGISLLSVEWTLPSEYGAPPSQYLRFTNEGAFVYSGLTTR